MVQRDIIKIDDELCDGCGECIPNCVEGALQIVDGKARLISDDLCDGIGLCLGHCPKGALTVITRDADEFSEEAVEEYLTTKKEIEGSSADDGEVFVFHHHAPGTPCGCPGSQNITLKPKTDTSSECIEANTPLATSKSTGSPADTKKSSGTGKPETSGSPSSSFSTLGHWPIKLHLVYEKAPFLKDADLLVLADCAGVASHDLHSTLLKDKAIVIFCPKFDDPEFYREKLGRIVAQSGVRSVTIAHMEVPCCFGLGRAVKDAVVASGLDIPVDHVIIKRDGAQECQ
jgi:NAD-dependent dihydropyrimidine dehydrogenase PreA subunit